MRTLFRGAALSDESHQVQSGNSQGLLVKLWQGNTRLGKGRGRNGERREEKERKTSRVKEELRKERKNEGRKEETT